MTTRQLVTVAMTAAAMLATPAMARESHAIRRPLAATADPAAGSYTDGYACIRAPAVGAFATQPWNNGPPCEPTTAY